MNQTNHTAKKKLSKKAISMIVWGGLLVLTHVVILLAIILSFRYYSIYPSLFGSLVSIIICLLIIIDIMFFIGFNHSDKPLKIISLVLTGLLLIGGSVGSFYVNKVNNVVNDVLGNDKTNKYETFSGVFVCYDKNNKFEQLSDLSGKKVGMIAESTKGIKYIAETELSNAKVTVGETKEYNTNTALLQALVDGEIDCGVITSGYRDIYSLERDENSPFARYLNNFIDFHSFSQELKSETTKSTKNISKEPFNVLLIGWSRTDIGSTVGLADSIILATVNPQTYTVSMMSIARDSFVPISCYGGEYDKINSGRSVSRACFIETVEDFIGMDIDYYMELDYLGLVQIVNTIGGVEINNPVDFELDGIFVPAGKYTADGQQALQFCRERHHMPNGDFDRQQHQKEVIMAVARKFIESGDVQLALNAMEAASDWMSTDFTLNELTTVFNLLLNTRNYTSLDTFDLVDFQTLRITGSGGIMYYSYSMRLPLWVYLIYQGSYDESMQHINDVMGNYANYTQDKSFEFSATKAYVRPPLYSLEYDDVFMFTPDPMPPYMINFSGMTLEEAYAWANANGVTITGVDYILMNDPLYDSELEGYIVDQSARYGDLISDSNSTRVTVMGTGEIDESKFVPSFVGRSYTKAKDWGNQYGVYVEIDFDPDVEGDIGKIVSQSPSAFTSIDDCDVLKIKVKAGEFDIKFSTKYGTAPSKITVTTGDKAKEFETLANVTEADTTYVFKGWYTSEGSNGTKVTSTSEVTGSNKSTVTLYAKWAKLYTITLDANGGSCDVSSITTAQDLPSASKTHYSFDGWYTAATDGSKVTDLSTISQATTLYAHYVAADWSETLGADAASSYCDATNDQGQKLSGCTLTGHGDETPTATCTYVDDITTATEDCTESDTCEEGYQCTSVTVTYTNGTATNRQCACELISTPEQPANETPQS